MVFHTFVPDKCLKLSAMKLQATPGAGAYFNEADTFEEGWQEQFWGTDNYNALLNVKKTWDPEGLFVCRQCVGSEEWDDGGMCRT